MKKLLLTAFCLFLGAGAFGQIQQGNFQLGGNLSYFSNENGALESSSYQVLPRVGYFVSDNFSLGVQVGLGGRSFESGNTEDTYDEFVYGIFGRFHKNLSEKVYLYIEPNLTLGSGDATIPTNNGSLETDYSSLRLGVNPGIIYFLTDKIGLEFGIGLIQYSEEKREGTNFNQTNDSFSLSLNPVQINTGLSIYF